MAASRLQGVVAAISDRPPPREKPGVATRPCVPLAVSAAFNAIPSILSLKLCRTAPQDLRGLEISVLSVKFGGDLLLAATLFERETPHRSHRLLHIAGGEWGVVPLWREGAVVANTSFLSRLQALKMCESTPAPRVGRPSRAGWLGWLCLDVLQSVWFFGRLFKSNAGSGALL